VQNINLLFLCRPGSIAVDLKIGIKIVIRFSSSTLLEHTMHSGAEANLSFLRILSHL